MATGDYLTMDELKRDLWPDDDVPDDVNDAKLARVITAISREIDGYTGTSFYDPGSDSTYYYTSRDGECVYIDPMTTVTSVATDDDLDRTWGTTWTLTTHYELWPYNTGGRGLPYVRIDRTPLSGYSFPTTPKGVKVVGRRCYNAAATIATVLPDIKEVATLKAIRLFKRKDAPFGVLGPTEVGQVSVIPGFDPDEKRILDQYKLNYI